jgi:hypothetical protein
VRVEIGSGIVQTNPNFGSFQNLARVYALFKFSPAEIALIEERTKYRYGEV